MRPDIVFTRSRIAVFVDGCFWHGCSDHGTLPERNQEYWTPKLAANAARDRRNDEALEREGWVVIRVWEHEPVAAASDRIVEVTSGRRTDRGALARGDGP